MILNQIIEKVDFTWKDLVDRPQQTVILLTDPTYFDVIDVKNPYMRGSVIDHPKSMDQWQALKSTYEQLKADGWVQDVVVSKAVNQLEDMVFCCNPVFGWEVEGKPVVVLSHMRFTSRQKEVQHHSEFLGHQGYEIMNLGVGGLFEGGGDAIPHPNKRLIWGGYGHRTEKHVYAEIADRLKTPVIALELTTPYFYHLDTCFSPLDEETVFICPDAFTMDGLKVIKQVFRRVIDIPLEDAKSTFCLNQHVIQTPPGHPPVVIIQDSDSVIFDYLDELGATVHRVQTGEFMKSGGSVFCMKAMLNPA